MKNIIISFTIFIILFIFIIFASSYLNKICSSMILDGENIEELINKGDFVKAYGKSLDLLEKWDKNKSTISVLVPHLEVDNINMEIYKLSQFIKCESKDEALASVHLLKFLIRHLMYLNKVNIQNVF